MTLFIIALKVFNIWATFVKKNYGNDLSKVAQSEHTVQDPFDPNMFILPQPARSPYANSNTTNKPFL